MHSIQVCELLHMHKVIWEAFLLVGKGAVDINIATCFCLVGVITSAAILVNSIICTIFGLPIFCVVAKHRLHLGHRRRVKAIHGLWQVREVTSHKYRTLYGH